MAQPALSIRRNQSNQGAPEKTVLMGLNTAAIVASTAVAARRVYSHSLAHSLFLCSLGMVTFNRVSTAQYWIWHQMFLPFLIKSIRRPNAFPQAVRSGLFWLTAHAAWMGAAYGQVDAQTHCCDGTGLFPCHISAMISIIHCPVNSAGRLEYRGEDAMILVWAASLLVLASNIHLYCTFSTIEAPGPDKPKEL